MRRRWKALAGAALLAGIAASARAGDDEAGAPVPPLPERVERAITRGVAWLKAKARSDGSFGPISAEHVYGQERPEHIVSFPAGPTALALTALLKCGVPPDDPVVRRGFEWLAKRWPVPESTYEVATLLLAIEARSNPWKTQREQRLHDPLSVQKGERIPSVKVPRADAAWIQRLADDLVRRKGRRAAWRYDFPGERPGEVPGGDQDVSATQFALLGLLAAERCGVRRPDTVWLATLEWLLDQQEADGEPTDREELGSGGAAPAGGTTDARRTVDRARGWAYLKDAPPPEGRDPTGSTTTCGLVGVLVCATVLEARGSTPYRARLKPRAERAWWDGIAWLRRHWSVRFNPPGVAHYHYYYLFGLERVGDLRGVRLFGSHDWYTEGATVLVDEQEEDGRWERRDTHEPCDVLNTCFALLFLNRSTSPITAR